MPVLGTSHNPIERLLERRFKLISSLADLRREMSKAVNSSKKYLNVMLTADLALLETVTVPASLQALTIEGAGKFKIIVNGTSGIDPLFSFSQGTNFTLQDLDIESTNWGGITSLLKVDDTVIVRGGIKLLKTRITNVAFLFFQGSPDVVDSMEIDGMRILGLTSNHVELIGDVIIARSRFVNIKSPYSSFVDMTFQDIARNNYFEDIYLEKGVINSTDCITGYNVWVNCYAADNMFLHKTDSSFSYNKSNAENYNEISGHTLLKGTVAASPVLTVCLTGSFAGDVKQKTYQAIVSTTDATPTALFTFETEPNRIYYMTADIQGCTPITMNNTGAITIRGRFRNEAGVVVQRGNLIDYTNCNLAWSANFNVNGTDAVLYVTGTLATDVKWTTTVTVNEQAGV